MNTQQVVAAEQLKYRDEISLVEVKLEEMGMRPDTEIRVYPETSGWYATVLVGYCVLIFVFRVDRIAVVDIQPFSGFYPNGGLIHRIED